MKQKKIDSDFQSGPGASHDFIGNFFLFKNVFQIFPLHGLFHRKKIEGNLELKLFGE